MSPSLVLCFTFVTFLGVVECLADDDDVDRQQVTPTRFVRCSILRNTLRNGRVKLRSRGRIAKFQCNQGYDLVGKRFSTCLLGKWNNPVPICVAKGCAHREAPPNGNVLQLHTGAVLLYTCLPGYVLHGSPSVHCDGRKWNDSIPTCEVASTDPALSCDFEDPNICGWTHDPSHDFDWRRHQMATPSGHVGTGPSFDHTLGKGQSGYYMYTEASSPRVENDTARLFSPVYTPNHAPGCFVFWYHMYGGTIGILRVYIKQEGQVFQELSPVWSVSGDQGNQWLRGAIPVPEMPHNFQIVVEGLRGSNYVGDSAIDDVSLRQTECQQEEPINATDSCQSRCGGMPAETTGICDCHDDCEVNKTCCEDYWNICSAAGRKNSSEVLPESENDEDNDIPITYSETESTKPEENTTRPVPMTTAIVTNTSTTTSTFPTTKDMVTMESTSTAFPTTEVIVTTSITTKIIPTTLLVTTLKENDTTIQSQGPSFFTSPVEEAATPDYEMPITEEGYRYVTTDQYRYVTTGLPDTDDDVPYTTEQPLVSDLPEDEMFPETTSSQILTQTSRTEDSTTEKVSSQTTESVETKTNTLTKIPAADDTTATRSLPTVDDSTVSVKIPPTSAIVPVPEMSTSTTPEIPQSDQESKTEIIPNNVTKSQTTITTRVSPTNSNKTSSETTSTDDPVKSIHPEQESGTIQAPEDTEDGEVTPAKWGGLPDSSGSRPKKEKPTTGFNREKESKEQSSSNYMVLVGVGSAVGILVVALLVGTVMYWKIYKRGKPKQKNLEDDSEIRYLSQSEVVEMAIPTDSC